MTTLADKRALVLGGSRGIGAAISQLIAEQGALDMLVINAGVLVMGDPLDLDPDDVDRMIDVNVRGP